LRTITAAAVALGVAACTPELADPELEALSPAWGWNGESTAVVAQGAAFYPEVRATPEGVHSLDDRFELWLDGPERVELDGVSASSFSTLDAVVPAGLAAGRYDLELRTPGGRSALLPNAFEVTDTRADHLELSIDSSAHLVGDWVIADLRLLDPEGAVVVADDDEAGLLVELRLSGEDDAAFAFSADALEDQEALDEGAGVRGRLDLDGTGFVAFRSQTPQVAQVQVLAADEASIAGDDDVVSWTAGAPTQVRVELPREAYSTVAGRSFSARLTLLDQDGNPTSGKTANLLLYDVCGSTFQQVSVADRATETVRVTEASGTTACPEQRLIAQGSGTYGESAAFEVLPDVATDLQVSAWPASVTAGSDTLKVLVAAQDAWGNALLDTTGGLSLADDAGGLSLVDGLGEQDCEDFQDGLAFCTAVLWRAGAQVVVTASSDGGLQGSSAPIEVLPSGAASVSVVVEELRVVAGEAFPVVVKLADGFGNPIEIDPTGGDAPVFTDLDGNRLSCTWLGPAGTDNAESFGCTATVARDEVVSVDVPARSVQGSSDPFEVVNGELASVDLDIGGVSSLAAGASLELTAEAVDAWGNAYVEQSDDTLDLSDLSGSVSPVTLTLGADGSGSATLSFTKATTGNRVSASFGGALVGTSPSFQVTAASLDHIEIEPARTWAWTGEASAVTVRAVDAWDNPVSGYGGSPIVTSSKSLGSPVSVSGMSDGEAEVLFTWSRAGLQDSLRVTDGVRSAVSSAVDVLSASCAAGPSAGLVVAGASTTTLCRTAGTTPATTVSAAGSSAGSSTLAAYHFDLGDGSWSRQTASSLSTTWTEEGQYDVQVVVADAAACGATATAEVWVADDDGEPAGPVTVEAADATLVAGSSSDGVTDVDLSAVDCTGDVARYGTLYVRADLGTVESSAASTVSATGSGLSVALDSSGKGTVSWTMAGTGDDGTATFYAGVLSGAALGQATAAVSGESRRPMVLSVSPRGATSSLFDELVIDFSEEMLASSATGARVQLVDPTGTAVAIETANLGFDAARRELTATLPGVQDAATGIWTLTLSAGLRDASGNQLDGLYTGAAAAFSLDFGAVPDSAPAVTACSPDTGLFVPDGDAGTGEEADEAVFSLTASAAATWWHVEISDDSGAEVRVDHEVAGSSASGSWAWDGRDQDGLLAPPGVYSLRFSAMDASWNEGSACEAEVALWQAYGG
jgi:hypothetical protein